MKRTVEMVPDAVQPLPAIEKNYDIEAVRGFAALFVVWHHAIVFRGLLSPGYNLTGLFSYAPSGHFCVLVFFVLSGYVIGLSNKKPLTWASSGTYLKKRFVRLYPIYFILLIAAILVTPRDFGLVTITGNLLLLQGLWVLDVNQPGWSLHYEMLYYLLFVLVSIYRGNPWYIAGIALLVGLGNLILFPTLHTPPIITAYAFGLMFWLLGLGISQWLAPLPQQKVPRQLLLGCILFMLCVDEFNPFDTLMHKGLTMAGIQGTFPTSFNWGKVAITVFDLSCIPFALLIILLFIGKQVPYLRVMLRVLMLIASINLLYVLKHVRASDLDYNLYGLPILFFFAALTCFFIRSSWLEKIGEKVVRVGVWLGSLSYGIYLVHFPLLILFSRINIGANTWPFFALRFLLLLVLSIGISYLLEKVLQPRLKAFFFKDAPVSLAVSAH